MGMYVCGACYIAMCGRTYDKTGGRAMGSVVPSLIPSVPSVITAL